MLILLTIINVILIAYLFLVAMRIILGWFAPQALGKAWELLTAATEPYLGLFRRIKFLRAGLFDFSPIAAVLLLVVALDLVNQLLYYGRITLGFFLASVLSAAWSGARFLLLLFIIVGLLRTIPLLFRAAVGSNLWKVVDMIIAPIVAWVMKVLRLRPRAGYTQHLLLTLGVLFIVWLLGEFLIIPTLRNLFQMLPI
ncbi:MAG: YggT family protein [Spirochaetia bacterium]